MPVTPIYSLPYQALADPPDGAGLGEDLALAVEAELARLNTATALYLPAASVASVSVSIVPVANTATVGAVSWGKTLPGTVRAWSTAITAAPGNSGVLETSVTDVTSTGCNVWVYRDNTTTTTVQVVAFGL